MPTFPFGDPSDPEAITDTDPSIIALLKRLRTLLGGGGSVRITDGVDTAVITPAGELYTAAAIATAGLPTYTEGAHVPLSVDLSGTLRGVGGGAGTVFVQPSTTLGWSVDSRPALTNAAVAAKASAGAVGGWVIHNPAAATTFVQVFNLAAASVVLGTTVPAFVIGLPAGATANVEITLGIPLSTAISWAATSTALGAGAPSTAAVAALLFK